MPSLVVSYSHTDRDIDLTVAAINGALEVYRLALDHGVERYLVGRPSQTVYGRYNHAQQPPETPPAPPGEMTEADRFAGGGRG
jgi:glutamate-1-semialdehyde 2,1-aminomutase